MKENLDNIDFLIADNTDRQLSTIDWAQLYSRIQNRLDDAPQQTNRLSIKRLALRWTVGITAVAAAILLAVFVLTENKKPPLVLPAGQLAVVQLTQHRPIAAVEIGKRADTNYVSVTIEPASSRTQVSFSQQEQRVAQCDVVIIDQNGQAEKEKNPLPSWIIIMASKPAVAENQTDQQQLDIACLL